QHLAGARRRTRGQLQALDLVAAAAGLVEQKAVTAAHIEQPTRRRVAADQVEEPAGGGATALLLVEVGVIADLSVEVVQLRPRGEGGLLHRPAIAAREQVAMLSWAMVGGRELAPLRTRRAPLKAQPERSGADPA